MWMVSRPKIFFWEGEAHIINTWAKKELGYTSKDESQKPTNAAGVAEECDYLPSPWVNHEGWNVVG